MNQKWLWSAILWSGALTLLSAADPLSSPKPHCADRFDFEQNTGFRAWPRENQSDLTQVDGPTGKALRIAPSKSSITAYQSLALKTPGPGTLSVSFDYNIVNSATKLGVQINFNLAGKGNGSGGRASAPVPAAEGWQKFHKIFSVPAGVAALQYTFNIEGTGAEVLIDNYTVSYSPDSISVPVAEKVNFDAPSSANDWNPKFISYGFFTFDQVANTPAQMQVAADHSGVYFLFRNFANPKQIQKDVTVHDGPVWKNDGNELIFFDEKHGVGWQFIVTASGTSFEGKLVQRVPGDPWTCDEKWSGEWKSAGKVLDNGFETRFFIPWETLGLKWGDNTDLAFSAACDYPAVNEFPNFNVYRGNRMAVGKFGRLTLAADGKLTVTRARDTEKLSYTIDRPNAKFETLLQKGTPGNYVMDVWSMGINRDDFPKAMESKYSDEEFNAWQNELLRAWAAAGIGGPAWPWVHRYGEERMKARVAKDGVKYPMFISNSDYGRRARKNGAKFIDPRNDFLTDSVDPAYVDAVENGILELPQSRLYPFIKDSVKFVLGLDEPTNTVEQCYNPAYNKANAAAIEELSKSVKAEYGFGKYGIPFMAGTSEKEMPFARIAFYRWWNAQYAASVVRQQQAVQKVLPGVMMVYCDDNNTAGQSMLDAAAANGTAQCISTDPYPTATNAYYGMGRAIYHVGFSCRVLRDLVPSAKLMIMPQMFIYHGGYGDIDAVREWCSQAMKNGAEYYMWFCTDAVHQIFQTYADMLDLSAMMLKMDKVVLPTETKTLVWYSNFDKYAKDDRALHSTYSVYAMLEEVLGSNFRFISDTTVTKGDVKLENYKLLYVPAMSYTTPEIAKTLAQWVKKGGTMVVFDPLFMLYNIDGNAIAERAALTGQSGVPTVKTAANSELVWNGKTLPAAMIANAAALPGSRFASYTVNAGKDKVLMTYTDGTPAALERKVGKGKVIYFAIQPFAGSDLVTRFGEWKNFFAQQAKAVGEKTDLPIKDFLLPKPPKAVNLKRMIQ